MKITGTLSNDCLKADEIAVLDALSAAIGEGTYLATLFNKPFILWATEQIKCDFPIDIYDRYNSVVTQVDHLNDVLHRETQEHMQDNDKNSCTVNELKYKLEHAEERIRIYADNYNACGNTLQERYDKIQEQASTISQLEQTVRDLKVKLYDILTKEM